VAIAKKTHCHPIVGVHQLGTDSLCLHLGGLERGLGGPKALLESL
jgi:hypothetical protein